MRLAPGTTLARYRVESHLGSGGMGEVYKAHDELLARSVALKILRPEIAEDSERIRRFTQEAKAASALNHPHIVHVYDIGVSDSMHFIAMEYVEGVTLRSLIEGQNTPLERLLALLAEVAEGLEKAHASGIVHRDLKPDNIIVSNDGYAKIVDFGLAKLIDRGSFAADDATAERPLTREGLIMGTVGYMAPEQILGAPVDHRADIFALGCIAYEAVAHHRAFEGSSTFDALNKIAHDPPPPLPSDTPADLQGIINRCLEKDPGKRFQSAREVATALREVRAHIDSSTLKTVAIRTSRNWTPFVVAGLSLVAVLCALFVFLAGRQRAATGAQGPTSHHAAHIEPLTASGKAREASISPNGKFVVYIDHDGLKGSSIVHIRDIGTKGDAIIARGRYLEYQYPAFAPESDYVYFTQANGERNDLYRSPLFGGSQKKIIEDVDTRVAFSPDGRRMAFIRRDSHLQRDKVIVSNSDGSSERVCYSRSRENALNSSPAVWLDNQTLVLATSAPAMILTLDVDGGALRRVDQREWVHVLPTALIPGTNRLVVAGTRTNDSEDQLWTYDLTTHASQAISTGVGRYGGGAISADGKRLVSTVRLTRAHIWTVAIDGSQPAVQVSSGTSTDGDRGVIFVPDGRILYWSNTAGLRDLVVANVDGTNPRALVSATADRSYAWLSSARTRPLIAYNVEMGGRRRVARMDLSNGNEKEIDGTDHGWWPAVAPQGDFVFYSLPQRQNIGLGRVALDGGAPHYLLDNHHCSFATIAPDGKRVACFSEIEGSGALAVFDIATNKLVTSFRPDTLKYPIRWSADSRAILIVRNDGQASNVWLHPIDSSTPRQLTHFESEIIWMFDVSPDGKTLVLSRGGVEDDVMLITDF
jgi:serine/threonine protein kinase/Tol biopolymer transport system component